MTRASRIAPFPEIPNARGAIYQFDSDKYAHAILITDPFRDYRPDTIFGHWSLEPFQARLRLASFARSPPRNALITAVSRPW